MTFFVFAYLNTLAVVPSVYFTMFSPFCMSASLAPLALYMAATFLPCVLLMPLMPVGSAYTKWSVTLGP